VPGKSVIDKKNKDIFLALIPLLVLFSLFGLLIFKLDLGQASKEKSSSEVVTRKISKNYYDYSLDNLEFASKNGKVVLFFATNWCSTCTELDKELMNDSEKLKSGITVLRIDFDKDTDLKKRYRVLVQHTLVQVDKNGNEKTKWVGGDISTINESVR
jgi:thiol:disulfide interchange protein